MVKKEAKKKVAKKKAKAFNGTNGAHTAPMAVTPPPAPEPPPPSFRAIKCEMEEEIRAFKDYVVEKYSSFYGHDLRKDAAWYLEQMGIGIASDMERVKRDERQRLIAENQAKEAAASAQILDGEKK